MYMYSFLSEMNIRLAVLKSHRYDDMRGWSIRMRLRRSGGFTGSCEYQMRGFKKIRTIF